MTKASVVFPEVSVLQSQSLGLGPALGHAGMGVSSVAYGMVKGVEEAGASNAMVPSVAAHTMGVFAAKRKEQEAWSPGPVKAVVNEHRVRPPALHAKVEAPSPTPL